MTQDAGEEPVSRSAGRMEQWARRLGWANAALFALSAPSLLYSHAQNGRNSWVVWPLVYAGAAELLLALPLLVLAPLVFFRAEEGEVSAWPIAGALFSFLTGGAALALGVIISTGNRG